jgi:hypothetical protein
VATDSLPCWSCELEGRIQRQAAEPFDAGGVVAGPVLMRNDGPSEEIKPPTV